MADGSLLTRAAARHPSAVAVVASGTRLSFPDLQNEVCEVAGGLIESGLNPGDRVGITMGPSLAQVLAVLSVWEIGCVPVPVSHMLTPIERDRSILPLSPALMLDRPEDVPRGASQDPAALRGDQARGAPAAILLTSGSTGESRCVEISHENLLAVNRAASRRLGLDSSDRWLLSLSIGHVGGLALLHRWLMTGSALEVRARFDATELIGSALEGRVTHASLVPTMLLQLVEALEAEGSARVRLDAAARFRCLLVGGAACPPILVERASALGLPIALTYGLTQATSQVATAIPAEVRAGGAGCGEPLEGIEVRIEGPVDGVGQILVRGPTVARRYVDTGEPVTDEEEWLHTGDLGRLDERGRLHVEGRRGRLILSGGVSVQPREVEEFLLGISGIRNAVVVGLPDERWGERVCAVVVPEHAGADPEGVRTSVDAACRDGLHPGKRPRSVLVVDSLPHTPVGKPDLGAVRRLVSESII